MIPWLALARERAAKRRANRQRLHAALAQHNIRQRTPLGETLLAGMGMGTGDAPGAAGGALATVW